MKLSDTLAGFFSLLILACTFINAAEQSKPKTLTSNEVSEQSQPSRPTRNEKIFALAKRMDAVNILMDQMLTKLAFLPEISAEEFESMMKVYVYMNAYSKMAHAGELNSYLLYDVLDNALGKLVLILSSHSISPTAPNQYGDCPSRNSFDEDIRPVLLKRSNWMRSQLLLSLVPKEVIDFVNQAHLMQLQIISELKPPPAFYGDLVSSKIFRLLDTTILVIASLCTGGTTGFYEIWKEALDYVMEHYFETLRYAFYEGIFPKIVAQDLLLCLAKLGIVFESAQCNLELAVMTRECIFKSQSIKVTTVLDYMKERRSTAKIQFVDNRPFAYLHPTIIGIDQISDFAEMIEQDLEEYWSLNQKEEDRAQIAKFTLGLMVIKDLILAMQRSIKSLSKTSAFHVQGFHIMAIVATIIPTAHMILLEVTAPLISPSFRGSVRSILETAEGSDPLRTVKFGALETACFLIEAELAILHKKEPQRALILYHFLELCRGIVALWVNIKLSANKENLGQQKGPLDTSLLIPITFNYSMTIYTDCLDFLSSGIPSFNLKNFQFLDLSTQVNMIIKSFTNFYIKQIIPTDAGIEFFKFVDRRIKENLAHPLYRQLRGLIRPEMLRKKPVKIPQKREKSQITHRPTLKPAKVKAVMPQNRSVDLSSPLGCNTEEARKDDQTKENGNTFNIALLAEKETMSNKETPGSQKETVKALSLAPLRLTNPKRSISESSDDTRVLIKPLKAVQVFSKPAEVLKQSGDLEGLKQENVWANTFQRLMPTFDGHLMPIQIKQPKPKAITSRVIDKFEEPTHHAATATSLGFVEGNIDPRDYLMALVLIGERLLKRKFEPMLAVFQRKQSTDYLSEMFYKSIDSFENEIRVLAKLEPEFLKPALKQAGLDTSADLLSCIKYYKLRIAACHPYVPKSTFLKKNITARHLTSLDVLQTYDPSMMLRMRHYLECYDEVFVRSIETGTDRPKVLYSPQCTDKVLATIGLFEIFPLEDIRMDRNEAAHKNTTDSKYAAYIQYVFGDSPDCEFLAKI